MQDVPKAEQSVLEKLIQLRQRLQLLNKDRTKYIRSQDVLAIYDSLIDQVQKLNTIRQTPFIKMSKIDWIPFSTMCFNY